MVRDIRPRLRPQLDRAEAGSLVAVLSDLAEKLRSILDANLVGVYLTGSFALGTGDIHSDVDFLVVTHHRLDETQETAVRDLHEVLPGRDEHWAHVLEGSYATLEDLKQRADPTIPWLYVNNGSRDMELSTHDNTEVLRWVLRNRAVTVDGPAAATLTDEVPPSVLRHEAACFAVRRMHDIDADRDYLRNAWGQPHEVLTRSRLLFTATQAQVIGKIDAGLWCKGIVPQRWGDLIDRAIADRPDPWVRVHQLADPMLAERTWEFVEYITPLIAEAAAQADRNTTP